MLDEKSGITYRENTFDEFILRESRSYFPLGLVDSDRILDLGGHIGCFAARAKLENQGVLVWSIEAEESNYKMLLQNGEKFKYGSFHGAIVDDTLEGHDIKIYVNQLKNNALHSTYETRGRSVQTVKGIGFRRALNGCNPTVIKCDIEGGEYELPWESLLTYPDIRYVVMELHLTRKGHREKARDILKTFQFMNFQLLNTPNIGEKNWTTMARWRRS